MEATQSPLDVSIIGGGPAGLTAALTLARQRHTAVVFDSGQYRNASANHIHTVLTWDHQDPNDFRAAAKANIQSDYETLKFHHTAADKIKKTEQCLFQVLDKDGNSWEGRKVILATGVVDLYPDIEGYDECWVSGM